MTNNTKPKLLEPDRGQIEQFFDALFRHRGTEGFISFRSFTHDNQAYNHEGVPAKCDFKYLCDVAVDHARRAANEVKPIVFCPPVVVLARKDGAKLKDVFEGLVLAVDCDQSPNKARAKLEAVLGPATATIRSGGKWTAPDGQEEDKLHDYRRLSRPARSPDDIEKLKRAQMLAAKLVGGDPSITVVHPLRWPGSWHRKNAPRLCEIDTLEPDREIDLDVALAALEAALPRDDGEEQQTNGFDHSADRGDDHERADWAALTADILAGNNLHESTARLAASYIGSGVAPKHALRQLRAVMLASSAKHDERWQARFDDLDRAVRTAEAQFKREQSGDHADEPSKVYWHGEVDYRASRPQLVQDVIPEVGHGLIAGQWGLFKTFAAFELAHSCMSGEPFLGYEIVRRGGVLFVALEGRDEVPIRLQGIIEARGKIEGHAPFAWIDACPPLIGKTAADEIYKIIAPIIAEFEKRFGVPIVLIIIDTVIAGAGYSKAGEENDSASGQAVMNTLKTIARRTGTFV
ncbi:MAG: AAA family ATPase, partial [Xanthobacteraceae bacterium]